MPFLLNFFFKLLLLCSNTYNFSKNFSSRVMKEFEKFVRRCQDKLVKRKEGAEGVV